jgi:hypothetical protein
MGVGSANGRRVGGTGPSGCFYGGEVVDFSTNSDSTSVKPCQLRIPSLDHDRTVDLARSKGVA